MERIHGVTLRELLKLRAIAAHSDNTDMIDLDLKPAFLDLIHNLFTNNFVHGDLKPENMMLTFSNNYNVNLRLIDPISHWKGNIISAEYNPKAFLDSLSDELSLSIIILEIWLGRLLFSKGRNTNGCEEKMREEIQEASRVLKDNHLAMDLLLFLSRAIDNNISVSKGKGHKILKCLVQSQYNLIISVPKKSYEEMIHNL